MRLRLRFLGTLPPAVLVAAALRPADAGTSAASGSEDAEPVRGLTG